MIKLNRIIRNTILIRSIFTILLVFIVVYICYVSPSMKLHTLNNEKFLKDFMLTQFDAYNNPRLLNTLSSRSGSMTLDYWYMYYHLRTKDYVFYTLFNKVNRFTDDINLCVYGINSSTRIPFNYVIPLKQKDININRDDKLIIVKKGNVFLYTINFKTNEMSYTLTIPEIQVHFKMLATDWTTNQGTFLPRYQPLRYLMNLDSKETDAVNEWMVDSPCTGKILEGSINGKNTGPGVMWFDTYSGTNYHYLNSYIWFYIHTDEWIIYLLQYDNKIKSSPILIKNIKQNRWFYSGVNNVNMFEPLRTMFKTLEPVDFTFSINGDFGNDFVVSFLSNDINILIKSKSGSIISLLKYFYYRSTDLNESTLSAHDLEYYNRIKNIRFDEYFCDATISIHYDGKKEEFDARVLYEIMHHV